MANENKLTTRFELQGAKQGSQDIKALTSDLQKLSQAAQQVFGSSSGLYSLSSLGKQPELVKALKENAKVMQAMTGSARASANPFIQPMLNQQLGIGAGQNRPDRKNYEAFWKSMIPPVIPPPVIQMARKAGNDFWKLIGEAALTAPVSPFGAARALSQAFGGGSIGGGGKGGGGLFGAGGADMFNLWFAAIRYFDAAVRALVNYMVAQIKRAFEEGSQLYTKGAQAGIAPGKIFAMQKAAAITGMDENAVQEMVMRSLAGNQGKNLATFKDRARFTGLRNEAQEVLTYFKEYEAQLDRLAGRLFNTTSAVKTLQGDLQVMWMLIAEQLSGGVRHLATQLSELIIKMNQAGVTTAIAKVLGDSIVQVAKAFEFLVLQFNTVGAAIKSVGMALSNLIATVVNLVAKIPGSGVNPMAKLDATAPLKAIAKEWKDFFTKNLNNEADAREGNRQRPFPLYIPPAGQWEKLGLSFGSVDGNEYSKQISRNTAETVKLLHIIVANGGGWQNRPTAYSSNMP